MLGIVQLPEQLLCQPSIRLTGRLCSSADSSMPIYVHHLLIHEVNMTPLQLHMCMANETSAASALHVVPRELPFAVPHFYAAS